MRLTFSYSAKGISMRKKWGRVIAWRRRLADPQSTSPFSLLLLFFVFFFF